MYHKRQIIPYIDKMLKIFPVIAITGPRQSGKSTLIQHYIDESWQYFSLDNRSLVLQIKQDPELFFQNYDKNIVIDEAQKIPGIFDTVKNIVDNEKNRKIILSGSANFQLMESITESLAGRIGLIELLPFSLSEYLLIPSNNIFKKIISSSTAKELKKLLLDSKLNIINEKQLLDFILYGGYPKLAILKSLEDKWIWLQNYISTFLERDVRELGQIANLDFFQKVYRILAFQTGNIFNASSISSDIGITNNTVKKYFSLLQTSYQCKELYAYFSNKRTQLIKSSKSYYLDTGIVNFIIGNDNILSMQNNREWGAILETHVYTELIKELINFIPKPSLYYWRTNNGAEVDFIINTGQKLIPIEVKSASSILPFHLRGMKSFMSAEKEKVDFGIFLYRGKEIVLLAENILAIPLCYLI